MSKAHKTRMDKATLDWYHKMNKKPEIESGELYKIMREWDSKKY